MSACRASEQWRTQCAVAGGHSMVTGTLAGRYDYTDCRHWWRHPLFCAEGEHNVLLATAEKAAPARAPVVISDGLFCADFVALSTLACRRGLFFCLCVAYEKSPSFARGSRCGFYLAALRGGAVRRIRRRRRDREREKEGKRQGGGSCGGWPSVHICHFICGMRPVCIDDVLGKYTAACCMGRYVQNMSREWRGGRNGRIDRHQISSIGTGTPPPYSVLAQRYSSPTPPSIARRTSST